MNQAFNDWLKEIARSRGILAAALFYPREQRFTVAGNLDLKEYDLEPLWQHIGDTLTGLRKEKKNAALLRWTFQKGEAWCKGRTDGIHLCLLAESAPGSKLAVSLDPIFDDFVCFRA